MLGFEQLSLDASANAPWGEKNMAKKEHPGENSEVKVEKRKI